MLAQNCLLYFYFIFIIVRVTPSLARPLLASIVITHLGTSRRGL